MMDLLDKGFDAMETNLKLGYDHITDISNAQDAEQNISKLSQQLKGRTSA